jgi:hypothetical protein
MKEEILQEFLNKDVIVGVPHPFEDRPFYFYGLLIDVNITSITLKTRGGYKQLDLEEIIEITPNKRSGR